MHNDSVANEQPQETPDAPVEAQPGTLVHHVTHMLQEANVENPEEWLGVVEREALTSTNVDVQRFHINRAWVAILTSVPDDKIIETRNARGCLMGGAKCSLEDWTRLFASEVIPCAIQQKLLTVKTST